MATSTPWLWPFERTTPALGKVRRERVRCRGGPYQVQAAIAAVHDEAARAEDTDSPQVVVLHDLLSCVAPNPMVTLTRRSRSPWCEDLAPGWTCWQPSTATSEFAGHHRLHGVRAHLLEMVGDAVAARASYRAAAGLTTSFPEQRYLEGRASRLERRGQ